MVWCGVVCRFVEENRRARLVTRYRGTTCTTNATWGRPELSQPSGHLNCGVTTCTNTDEFDSVRQFVTCPVAGLWPVVTINLCWQRLKPKVWNIIWRITCWVRSAIIGRGCESSLHRLWERRWLKSVRHKIDIHINVSKFTVTCLGYYSVHFCVPWCFLLVWYLSGIRSHVVSLRVPRAIDICQGCRPIGDSNLTPRCSRHQVTNTRQIFEILLAKASTFFSNEIF